MIARFREAGKQLGAVLLFSKSENFLTVTNVTLHDADSRSSSKCSHSIFFKLVSSKEANDGTFQRVRGAGPSTPAQRTVALSSSRHTARRERTARGDTSVAPKEPQERVTPASTRLAPELEGSH